MSAGGMKKPKKEKPGQPAHVPHGNPVAHATSPGNRTMKKHGMSAPGGDGDTGPVADKGPAKMEGVEGNQSVTNHPVPRVHAMKSNHSHGMSNCTGKEGARGLTHDMVGRCEKGGMRHGAGPVVSGGMSGNDHGATAIEHAAKGTFGGEDEEGDEPEKGKDTNPDEEKDDA